MAKACVFLSPGPCGQLWRAEAYIARIGQIAAARDLQDLYEGPGRFEALTGDRKGQYSFRLGKGARLIVTIEDDEKTVAVLEVSDHYGD